MPYSDALDIRVTDSSLRDGSHAKGHQFTEDMVRAVVAGLDGAGVPVIEVTHGDGLGGSSFNYGFSHDRRAHADEGGRRRGPHAKIAALMLPGVGTKDDISAIADIGVAVVRIATHCTEADIAIQHFGLARQLGLETVGFLMMAHSQPPELLAAQARIMADAGCQCVYVVDSAGALILDQVTDRVAAVVAELGPDAQVGFHGHENLALGVANSICRRPGRGGADRRLHTTVRRRGRQHARPRRSPRCAPSSASAPASTCWRSSTSPRTSCGR